MHFTSVHHQFGHNDHGILFKGVQLFQAVIKSNCNFQMENEKKNLSWKLHLSLSVFFFYFVCLCSIDDWFCNYFVCNGQTMQKSVNISRFHIITKIRFLLNHVAFTFKITKKFVQHDGRRCRFLSILFLNWRHKTFIDSKMHRMNRI